MKPNLHFKSIRRRLTFWFFTAALIPMLAVGLINYKQRAADIKRQEADKLAAIMNLKINRINAWLDERIGDVRVMAENPRIRDLEKIFQKPALSADDLEVVSTVRVDLNRYVKNLREYSEIFIVNPVTGKIQVSTDIAHEGDNRSDAPYFTEPMKTKKLFVGDIYYSKTLNTPTMTFSIPVICLAHSIHIVGILVARIDLTQSLYPLLLDRTGMGDTGETLIVNRKGTALSELRWFQNAPLRLKIHAVPARRAAAGKEGVIESMDYRGKPVLAAYSHIEKTGWGLVAKQDTREIYAPVRAMLFNFLLLLFIFAGLAYLLSFLLARTISFPAKELTRAVKRMEGGDLTARSHVTKIDEIGFLSAAFNRMAETIASRTRVQQNLAGIIQTMIEAADLKTFGRELLKNLSDACGAQVSAFYRLNHNGMGFEPLVSMGADPKRLSSFEAETLEGEPGRAVATKEISRIRDIPKDTVFTFKTVSGTLLPKEIITIPLMIENSVEGVISLAGISPFSEEATETLKAAHKSINTGFSHMISAEKTRRLARLLDKKNRQLQAQTEELQAQTEELQQQSEELQQQSEELQQQSEELQEQNAELEIQKQKVEESDRLKSEFLSNMSHELRTPLNSVLSLSRLLATQAKDRLSEKEIHFLEIIEKNGEELLSLINDILDLSRMEAGVMEMEPRPFSMSQLIEAIVERMQPLAAEKGIYIKQDIPAGLPMLESDEKLVHQILQNLVANAVKFTETGGVTVSAEADDQTLFIRIADTGIGIKEKDIPHIFEKFRQADGSSARKYEGTGLGLAIARRAAAMLFGKLSVQSIYGKGTTFSLSLPLKWPGPGPEHGAPGPTTRIEKTELPERPVPRPEPGPAGRWILLVEDNEAAVIQVKKTLENEGYRVDVARNGKAALNFLAEKTPDGIILDLMMPGMDGFEVADRVRRVPATAHIPILVLTAKDLTKQELDRLRDDRINHLARKGDLDRAELLAVVRGLFKT